jgi:tRNA G10  N-methylase Trm11
MMNNMQWFALLGREKSLVQAELAIVTHNTKVDFIEPLAIGTNTPPIWDNLGGVIRAGEIASQTAHTTTLAQDAVKVLADPPPTGKVTIGISSANLSPLELRNIGKELKKYYIQAHNKRPRIIFPQAGTILNAGHIKGGKLLDKPNSEIFFIKYHKSWLIGVTTWQQDIPSYTQRDRDRPARDARVGMLPPKLAQIMLNLGSITNISHVHDPFCGTGVILTEALLKQAHVSGSDISTDMIDATRKNLNWFSNLHRTPQTDFEVFQADAKTVQLPPSTTHIISEGYLGNPNLHNSSAQKLQDEASNLSPLYHNVFKNFLNFPKPLTIIFALPVWFTADTKSPIHLPILDDLSDMGYTVEQFAPDYTTRLMYRRPHQTVGRAIIKLKKG